MLLLAPIAADVAAQARRPGSSDEVIEHIPEFKRQQALRRLQELLRAQPADEDLAAAVVQAQLTLARRTGDPRYLGYAQTSLAPWWSDPAPPPRIALLRASVLQKRHEFPAALKDYDYVLRREGNNGNALFARAVIHQVTGDYARAAQDCRLLMALRADSAAAACLASVQGLNGQGQQSARALQRLLVRGNELDPELRVWILTASAELAQRLGRPAEARQYFEVALPLSPQDPYLLGAYADFLLAMKQPQETLTLLKDAGASDAMLLRRALAQRALGQDAGAAIAQLRERFAGYQQRKDGSHSRERARFALHLEDDPRLALQLARDNWERQREPADTALVLAAALKARDAGAAQATLGWLRAARLEDVELARLAQAIRQLPRGGA
ncbi:hypothetical protein DUGA2_64480 [Duganella sp. HH101]|nr:hypothetical protein DUGA2_64480 [Duganella sp. HH101]